MIEFVYPWAFILLILPLFVIWFVPAYKQKKSSVQVPYFARLVDVSGEKPQTGAVTLNRKNVQRFIVALAWLCLVTAMAKPEMIGPAINKQQSARDLMIAVDLSGSMQVEDFKTSDNQTVNRLVAVKTVLAEFAKGRESDRLGLILFGDAPYLQAPFTDDIDTWLQLLNESEIGMAGQSTAFGDAIGLAISVFENSKTDNRVLIVLTDGNDTSSRVPPVDAAKVAASYNIKIYTIAVGDPQAVGEEKVDMDVLNEISKVTGGSTYQALNRAELQSVYKEIDDLEEQQFESLSFRPKTSVHYYPVALVFIIYLLLLLAINISVKYRGAN
ncbi:VWA domain-containing protein [Colwelliaceae bacterium BS250]